MILLSLIPIIKNDENLALNKLHCKQSRDITIH